MTKKIIGEKIKYAVKKTGLTNQEFCKKVGIGESVISRWLKGDRNPSITSLKKIAKATKTPLEYFINNNQKIFDNSNNSGIIGSNNTIDNTKVELIEEKLKRHELEINLLQEKIKFLEGKKK